MLTQKVLPQALRAAALCAALLGAPLLATAATAASATAPTSSASSASSPAAAIVVRDDAGQMLHLAQPARRIVSLAPHITETLYAAGVGDRLVGTVDYSDFPAAARQLPHVGGYSRIDAEAVAALKPDLVIAWQSGNAPAQIERLRALGIPVFLSQPNHIDDVASALQRFGVLGGDAAAGEAAAARFRERLANLSARYRQRPRVRTFYQIWKQPLMTVGGQQIISDVIRLCGGENVFASLTAMAPTVTVEGVLAANPEAIVASGMDAARPEWLDDWRRWPALTAVARDNLFYVPPELIQRHTPRLLEGAERLCQALETARARR
ncbi:cobalamin-binding protein [Rhodocyclus tenuis]|uniref:ABC transporter substrate-binding protein n=2 Tax=Rhodocyclus TaxID=1064 RepID=A0A6L5K1Z0_RHOTE|nr:cobalamin-binding protein [Rhodocyclus gracilis]MQY52548.1 ABC transporter substrate-binding protein [Rhodocyclus gracilis]MRD73993.1 ABC transporter substrate-binding protein [Rhodocyclus gracilis]NJA89999.1 cobalamin-binding protein [Rhodocyclus gracilis]